MGFFGFLKKKEAPIAAPVKPDQGTPDTTADPTGVPPPMDSPPPFPATEGALDPELGMMPPQDEGIPPPPGGIPTATDPVHNDADLADFPPLPDHQIAEMPPQETREEAETLPLSPGPETHDLPDFTDEQPATEEAPLIPENTTPAVEEASPAPEDEAQPEPVNLPDFSDDDIAKAEEAEAPYHRQQVIEELPPLDDEEGEVKFVTNNFFVPATAYRDALGAIKSIKSKVKGGEGSLSKLSTTITEHKTDLASFAEKLNDIQEEMIVMDNILLNER